MATTVDQLPLSTPRRRLSLRAQEEIAAYLLIAPWLIGFTVFVAGGLIFNFVLSFFQTDLLSTAKFIGLGNYRQLLTDDRLFWQALRVTSVYTFATVPLQTLLGLGVALLLNQKVWGQGFWRTLFYLPSVVSGVAVGMIWLWFYHPDLGLFNILLGRLGLEGPRWLVSQTWALPALIFMNVWGIGTIMLIFLAGLQGIQQEYYEAARIDGAANWQQFTAITLPMLSPQIFYNVVLGIISSYQVFTQSFVMTEGGPNNATLTLVLFLYSRAFLMARFGYAAAIAWLLFLIILLLTLFLLRSSQVAVFYEGRHDG